MSVTFFNMRRRQAAAKAKEAATVPASKPKEEAKPVKTTKASK